MHLSIIAHEHRVLGAQSSQTKCNTPG
jgi:hypothetical protein